MGFWLHFSESFLKKVILLLTLALLWTQSLGLQHSIDHGKHDLNAITKSYSSASKMEYFVTDDANSSSVELDNSSFKHSCIAWDACSVAYAVILSQLLFEPLSFNYSRQLPPTATSFSTSFTPTYLSRAPPFLGMNSL